MNKRLIYIASAIVVVVLLVAYFLFFAPNITTNGKQKQYLMLKEGADYVEVLRQLNQKVDILSDFTFRRSVAIFNYEENVKPGRYLLKSGMSNFSLLRMLKGGRQTPVQLTFNNIRTKEQLASVLSKQVEPDSVQFVELLNDSVFLSTYGLNQYTSVAIFLPNTYQVFWNITPEKLFEKMFKEYDRFWTPERKKKASEIPLTQAEVITLASIVESESNNKIEKPIIAGLYINRLRNNMPLQADPTIVFAVGDFSIKRVTGAYTSVKSPYNTYRNKGLPPGPIRIPNIKSIEAVLNFDKNDFIYMCAKETLNGEHNFSSSWAEHQANALKYQQALNMRGIN